MGTRLTEMCYSLGMAELEVERGWFAAELRRTTTSIFGALKDRAGKPSNVKATAERLVNQLADDVAATRPVGSSYLSRNELGPSSNISKDLQRIATSCLRSTTLRVDNHEFILKLTGPRPVDRGTADTVAGEKLYLAWSTEPNITLVDKRRPAPRLTTTVVAAMNRVEELLEQRESFYGREEELRWLDAHLKKLSAVMLLTGGAQTGKSSLLREWIRRLVAENQADIAVHIFARDMAPELTHPAIAYEHLTHQLVPFLKDEVLLTPDESLLASSFAGLLAGLRPTRALVVVVDGLDEQDNDSVVNFRLQLPATLPDHVFVVASARSEWLESASDAPAWQNQSRVERWNLSNLDAHAVRVWSQDALGVHSSDKIQDLLWARTSGYPVHLRCLFDDIGQLKDTGAVAAYLEQTPQSYRDYVRSVIRDLSRHPTKTAVTLFATLTAAFAPLTLNELAVADVGLTDIYDLPNYITRWLRIHTAESIFYYSLGAPSIFTDTVRDLLATEISRASTVLLEYCRAWLQHKAPYALRYLPLHLRQASLFSELRALVDDHEFSDTQHTVLSGERFLPAETAAEALRLACDIGNYRAAAELLLLFAKEQRHIPSDDPSRWTPTEWRSITRWTTGKADVALTLAALWFVDRNSNLSRELKAQELTRLLSTLIPYHAPDGPLIANIVAGLSNLSHTEAAACVISWGDWAFQTFTAARSTIFLNDYRELYSLSLDYGIHLQSPARVNLAIAAMRAGDFEFSDHLVSDVADVAEAADLLCRIASWAATNRPLAVERCLEMIRQMNLQRFRTTGGGMDLRRPLAAALAAAVASTAPEAAAAREQRLDELSTLCRSRGGIRADRALAWASLIGANSVLSRNPAAAQRAFDNEIELLQRSASGSLTAAFVRITSVASLASDSDNARQRLQESIGALRGAAAQMDLGVAIQATLGAVANTVDLRSVHGLLTEFEEVTDAAELGYRMISSLCRSGRHKDALEFAQQSLPNSLRSLIEILRSAPVVDEVFMTEVCGLYVRSALSQELRRTQIQAAHVLLVGAAVKGGHNRLAEMIASKVLRQHWVNVDLRNQLAQFVKLGEILAAANLLCAARYAFLRSARLSARLPSRQRPWARAKIISALERLRLRMDSYAEAAYHIPATMKALKRLATTARMLNPLHARVQALTDIARHVSDVPPISPMAREADTLFTEAEECATSIASKFRRRIALRTIWCYRAAASRSPSMSGATSPLLPYEDAWLTGILRANSGDFIGALDSAATISHRFALAPLLRHIALRSINVADLELAEKVFLQLLDIDRGSCARVLEAFCDAGAVAVLRRLLPFCCISSGLAYIAIGAISVVEPILVSDLESLLDSGVESSPVRPSDDFAALHGENRSKTA